MWSMSLRQSVFSAILIEYLTNGTLLSITATSDQLGSRYSDQSLSHASKITYHGLFKVQEEWKDRFVLSVEDYLHGVITMVNELVRSSRTQPMF